jgi:quercetin dioxygenase-like cupin family protein
MRGMSLSRRELSFLLTGTAAAQGQDRTAALPTQLLRHEDLKSRQNGALLSRQILKGETHTGYQVDLHESELAVGQAPHAPHHHLHEEMLVIRSGLLEVTVGAKATRLGTGSVAYFASNEEHGWRNVGDATALYLVLALGTDKP